MKCPDCKNGNLILKESMTGTDLEEVDAETYCKCDSCKTEYQPDDVEE